MLTQCPNCQTIFRVTSEILRVAEGQVRCGRCQRQFDALARLIDENDDDESSAAARLPSPANEPSPEDIEVEEPDTHEDITMEGRHIEISGTYRVPDRYGNVSEFQQETSEEWVELDDVDEESHTQEEADALPGENVESSDASDEVTDAEAEALEAEIQAIHREQQFRDLSRTAERTTGSPRFAQRRAAADAADQSTEVDLFGSPVRKAATPKLWRFLAAPLVLLLIVQWVHSYRATLARHPTIGAPLISAYHALGLSLTPNWDLHAYQIRQWGVISDPSTPGTLRVRASVTNLADFAQPYPLLKLVLEDRWGDQIRAREFEPIEYLDSTVAPNRMLSPGQQANATIAIVDPGPDAEGFRFDVCLRGNAGTVCGEEVRRK
jgi:predicted Zn finger-like uncharacterized protein